jgi:hypothetical protein
MQLPVNDWLLLNAKWTIFQLYHDENKLIHWDDTDIEFVLYHQAENSPTVDMSLYSDTLTWFWYTSLCSFSSLLSAYRRSNIFQFHGPYFDWTGARAHDLQQSIRARKPLRHRCGCWWYTPITKVVIRSRKSKKYRQYNGRQERDKRQIMVHKTMVQKTKEQHEPH